MDNGKDFLHRRLIKLGDMLGDGDCEPWVEKEYARTLRALGIKKPRRDRSKEINERMKQRVVDVKCSCGGPLQQVRSGSMMARCRDCGVKYILLKSVKKKK